MSAILNIAIKAARLAGKIIVHAQDHRENLAIIQKGPNDFASKIDHQAEEIIIDTIKRAYPEHAILAEESGATDLDRSETVWIIDPLDGTTNFLHGFPQCCVSIAVQDRGILTHGVVYDPLRDELFTASRGRGAQMNGKRLRVSNLDKLDYALLGTGFPFREFGFLDEYINLFKALMPKCSGIRRAGAAALDLAYVAAGRLDGFWEFGLQPWDMAAGALLIQEAGGWVTTLEGDKNFLEGKSILAASPKIHQHMMSLYQAYIPS